MKKHVNGQRNFPSDLGPVKAAEWFKTNPKWDKLLAPVKQVLNDPTFTLEPMDSMGGDTIQGALYVAARPRGVCDGP